MKWPYHVTILTWLPQKLVLTVLGCDVYCFKYQCSEVQNPPLHFFTDPGICEKSTPCCTIDCLQLYWPTQELAHCWSDNELETPSASSWRPEELIHCHVFTTSVMWHGFILNNHPPMTSRLFLNGFILVTPWIMALLLVSAWMLIFYTEWILFWPLMLPWLLRMAVMGSLTPQDEREWKISESLLPIWCQFLDTLACLSDARKLLLKTSFWSIVHWCSMLSCGQILFLSFDTNDHTKFLIWFCVDSLLINQIQELGLPTDYEPSKNCLKA